MKAATVPTRPALASTPRAPLSCCLAAPVADALVDALLEAELVGLEFDDAAEDEVGAALLEAEEVGAPPRGAVEAASISCWTVELNWPVIAVSVNLAEKASAGNCGFLGSVRLRDWKRMKLGEIVRERRGRWRRVHSLEVAGGADGGVGGEGDGTGR